MELKSLSVNVTTNDADEAAGFFTAMVRPVRVEPARGEALIDLHACGWRRGPFATMRVTSERGLVLRPVAPLEAIGIMLPTVGYLGIHTASTHVRAMPENGCIVDLCYEALTFSPSLSSLAITLDRDSLVRHLVGLLDAPVPQPIVFSGSVDASAAAGATLWRIAQTLECGLHPEKPLATQQLFESLIAFLIEALPHNYTERLHAPASSAAPRQVKRAIEFMEAHADKPITMVDVANAAQVSIRALQLAFRTFRQATPLAHLRQIRLEAVRRDLLAAEGSANIAVIARKWGFVHLGHFARHYRAHYGELPSETVSRAGRAIETGIPKRSRRARRD
jgi:AraC-like DNA-binding protein